jgi:hypothetical protein
MKNLSLSFLILLLAFGLQSQTPATKKKSEKASSKKEKKDAKSTSKTPAAPAVTSEKAEISFVDKEHNFNEVIEGPEAIYVFKFYNTGKEPLTLTGAQPGCSCTVSDYTKEPIMPGKSGSITVKYGTKGRIGAFTKTVTVTSNAVSNPVTLTITGTVVPAPQEVH